MTTSEAGSSGYGTPEPGVNGGTEKAKMNGGGSALGKRKVTFADDRDGEDGNVAGPGQRESENGSKRAKVEEVEDSGK